MAGPLTPPRGGDGSKLPVPATTTPHAPRTAPPGKTYAGRFGASYIALLLVLAAVGVGTYFIVRDDSGDDGSTSVAARGDGFQPGPGVLGAANVSRYVSSRYRVTPNGPELVALIAQRPNVSRRPIQTIVVEPGDAQTVPDISTVDRPNAPFYTKDFAVIPMQNGITFQLCGTGDNCAIEGGESSPERLRLVQLEALEAALRTFKADPDIQNVVAFLPPAQAPQQEPLDFTALQQAIQAASQQDASLALLTVVVQMQQLLFRQLQDQQAATDAANQGQRTMFFRRIDLLPEINRPLETTLPHVNVPRLTVADLSADDVQAIGELSKPFMYDSVVQLGGDGNPVIYLDPIRS